MFMDPLTDKALYWLGYLQADGSMSKNGRVILAQIHKEPLEDFLEFSRGRGGIVHTTNQKTTFGIRKNLYTVGTSGPYEQLRSLGLKKELREDIYQSKHFWRGMVDGDGTLGIYKYRQNFYPKIGWSGNEYDISKLASWLEPIVGKFSVVKCRSIFAINISGNKAKHLTELLYKNEYSSLSYKKDKANLIMNWEPTDPRRGWKP